MLDAVDGDGFRAIRPLRSEHGAWVCDGWTAWRWIEGEHARGDWASVVAAANAFHAALAAAAFRMTGDGRPRWLDTRQHRWARAERTVWHGAPLPPTINTGALEWSMFDRAAALGPPLDDAGRATCQVVHGDIAGNALMTDDGIVAFIDMSPGWRPASSSAVQVLVEAVAWFGADPSLLRRVDREEAARACGFRLLCGLQSVDDWVGRLPEEVENWQRVLTAIGA